MKKEDLPAVAHLVSALNDSAQALESAYNKKDAEKLASLKKEILSLQEQIDNLL